MSTCGRERKMSQGEGEAAVERDGHAASLARPMTPPPSPMAQKHPFKSRGSPASHSPAAPSLAVAGRAAHSTHGDLEVEAYVRRGRRAAAGCSGGLVEAPCVRGRRTIGAALGRHDGDSHDDEEDGGRARGVVDAGWGRVASDRR